MHNSLLLYCTPVLFAGFKNIFTTHGLQYMLYIEAIFLLTYFPRCLNIRELHKAFESYFNLHLKFPHSVCIPGWRQSDFFFFLISQCFPVVHTYAKYFYLFWCAPWLRNATRPASFQSPANCRWIDKNIWSAIALSVKWNKNSFLTTYWQGEVVHSQCVSLVQC